MTDRRAPLDLLRVCAWPTVSLRSDEVAAIRGASRERHPGAAFVESCQRFEAYQLQPCDCDAPEHATGADALRRLGEVASGLHSVVIGEAQIMGQVRAAFESAEPALRGVADIAIASAREFRRQQTFDSHAGHLLDRALKIADVPARGRLLVLGAGAMGRLIADRAIELGFAEVVVAARRRPPSEEFRGCEIVLLSKLHALGPVDVAVGCLGSSAAEMDNASLPVINALAIDLGTPRNFGDLAVTTIRIADMLADEAARPHARRKRTALKAAHNLVFEHRLRLAAEDSASAVGAMRRAVEEVRKREVARMHRLHPEVAPETLDAMTRSLVNQIFHPASARLRALDDATLGRELAGLFTGS